jgi:hypothetical protein
MVDFEHGVGHCLIIDDRQVEGSEVLVVTRAAFICGVLKYTAFEASTKIVLKVRRMSSGFLEIDSSSDFSTLLSRDGPRASIASINLLTDAGVSCLTPGKRSLSRRESPAGGCDDARRHAPTCD